MGEWQGMRWLRLHAIVAPFGGFAVTALLVVRSGQWSGWDSLESASSLIDLGAVLYGMVAVLVERGANMVFWALEQRKKRREAMEERVMAQGMARGLEQGMAQGRAQLLAELLDEGIPQTKEDLERWARKKGIPLD